MSANVVHFRKLFRPSLGWSSSELSEFYRVEGALLKAGLPIDTDSGISDEGDPWFAFCRGTDGEVIVHIARIGRIYYLVSPSYEGYASGSDLRSLVCELVSRHPLVELSQRNNGSNVFLHPAALLTAVVATAFFRATEARADVQKSESRGGVPVNRSDVAVGGEAHKVVSIDAAHTAIMLYAIAEATHSEGLITVLSPTELVDYSSPTLSELTVNLDQTHLGHEQALVTIDIGQIPAPSLSLAEVVADSLPLVTILWDLAKTPAETPVKHSEGFFVLAPPTSVPPIESSVTVELTMGLSESHSRLLPAIEASRITFGGAHGGAETREFSEPNQLSATLLKALESATHYIVDLQLHNTQAASLAAAFVSFLRSADNNLHPVDLTGGSANIATPAAISAEQSAILGPSSVEDVSAHVQGGSSVQQIVEHFMDAVPKYVISEIGKDVIIYDAVAVENEHVISVVFDFADGSTLKLIGLAADLHQPTHA